MNGLQIFKSALIGGASIFVLAGPAAAKVFDIPRGDLDAALDAYSSQSGVQLVYSDAAVRGHHTKGVKGQYSEIAALNEVLSGTGFTTQMTPSNAIGIVPEAQKPHVMVAQAARRAPAAPAASGPAMPATVETVVVTAQKKSENIQNVPIAVTALSQAQLTERQIAGGPDLVKEVPNLTFSKTNFTGYNLEIRGIGTQAISVTTDPAVAVAFNGTPFIRNHFFEQEFFDLADVEVLRGPQGTLYGRNATAGVVNIKSALPTDEYEAMLSADMGNFSNRRLEAMVNIPIVGDRLGLRIAGEWTKRDGYSFNELTNAPIDGRDLWSGRVTLGWKPADNLQVHAVWEHFQENDDRMRTSKQLCKTAENPDTIDGIPVLGHYVGASAYDVRYYVSQGCEDTSLFSPNAYQVPNGYSLPFASAIGFPDPAIRQEFDPYASTTQSRDLRVIESTLNPIYKAKNDTLELNVDYSVTPALTFTSQTGYNHDFLWSTEDYNRFNTQPGMFELSAYANTQAWQLNSIIPDPTGLHLCEGNDMYAGSCEGLPIGTPCNPSAPGANNSCQLTGAFCDPQLGCSDRLVAEDLSDERSWQFSQEFRLSSNFSGPLNFSLGGNILHYETVENYYVFINTLTSYTATGGGGSGGQTAQWIPGVSDNSQCMRGGYVLVNVFIPQSPTNGGCSYIDPNPLTSLNNQGHNYFLSQNPYVLNSYALFGETYYNITSDLKLTGGLRWTDDRKHFIDIPSELVVPGYGYPVTGVVDQQWSEWTGRATADWTPKLDFTDQTLIYGSFSRGYKAGGANPPGAKLLTFIRGDLSNPIHPLTFKPEFIDAFELGSKNTLLDGALTVNGDIFYYNYQGYQISRIVDRTAINDNFKAHVEGAELESSWEPMAGLKLNFAGGYENARLAGGSQSIDLMDRTAGNPDWMVLKPFITQASNCIVPIYVAAASLFNGFTQESDVCADAYNRHVDPLTSLPYVANPSTSLYFPPPASGLPNGPLPAWYPGFDPLAGTPGDPYTGQNYDPLTGRDVGPAPNNGEGFDKNLSGHQLPNAPHFTTSLSVEYTLPVSDDWAATLHTDFYWQSQSWARVFQDPIDKLHGYSNVNLALILTSANGWQVMGYVKNIFDTTAITGTFLNSDDSGLTTNVFLTDPRLFGVRVTKQLDQNDGFWGSDYSGYDLFTDLFADKDGGRPVLWIELGGQLSRLDNQTVAFAPPIMDNRPAVLSPSQKFEHPSLYSIDETAKVSFEPQGSDWILSASIRYGHTSRSRHERQQTNPKPFVTYLSYGGVDHRYAKYAIASRFADTAAKTSERHMVVDFQVGKDVGLGFFGNKGTSDVDIGVRFAQFSTKTNITLHSDPDWHFHYKYFYGHKFGQQAYHTNMAKLEAKRDFHGVGPSLSWKTSMSFVGNAQDSGEIDFDWGVNAALLFGKQKAKVHHQSSGQYRPAGNYSFRYPTNTPPPVDKSRTRSVTVPDIGGFAGVSYRYNNAKISFGYRADEFFGAMDGGIDTYKSENRGFFGPYANVSIGLGG